MTTWGYILDAPGRPRASDQRRTLALLGCDAGAFGTIFEDRIKRGSTRPRSQLVGRSDLIHSVQPGDTVVFAAPFCIGLSGKDAEWCLSELQARGVGVVVSADLTRIEPGQDVEPMVSRVAAAQNAHHVRASKAKAHRSK